MIGNRMADPPSGSWWLMPAYGYLVVSIGNGIVAVVALARVVTRAAVGAGWAWPTVLVAAWTGVTAILMALMDDEGVRVEEQRDEILDECP